MPERIARYFASHQYLKRKIVFIAVIVVVFAVTIEIWVSNRLSTFGEKINSLESTKYSLQLENEYLKNQIAQKKSLKLNEKKSEFLGFGKIKNIEYIQDRSFALNSNKF